MARKPRALLPESCYHITQKCNYDAFLLEDPETCCHYLTMMVEIFMKYGLPILAYCLMKNHIHLLVKTGLEPSKLSFAMRELSGRVAADYNRRHGKHGHFWADRFRSVLVAGLYHLRNAVPYIDANPLNTTEQQDPIDWVFCSFYESQNPENKQVRVDRKALLEAIQFESIEQFLDWQKRMMDLQRGVKQTEAAEQNEHFAGHYALGVHEELETLQMRLLKRGMYSYMTCLETENEDKPALWALDLCGHTYARRKVMRRIRHHLRMHLHRY